ncbi:hypothetical protein [Azoarcus indigens]|uniref:Transmembrane protein n=1 Tax=Azoarcus indigens TaxID=29545 RepID=A0A4R6EHF7_9RHOO|nr:hypothetical protein [Azoarcus indigens]TDN56857.1 hypothetical protein C7389_101236 [Azoarcus indigens]
MGRKLRIRSKAVLRLQHRLEQNGWPRLQMALIVLLTGLAGLLCSFLMLLAGIDSMAVRYPLALGLAYGFFLFMLWLWLRNRGDDPGFGDLVSGDFNWNPGSGGRLAAPRSGGGGDFAGGGASASFEAPAAVPLPAEADSGWSLGKGAASVADADELAIPLAVVVFCLGLMLASFYLIYLAPALFAELLFDGVLSYSLYRRLRRTGDDADHWLVTACRRTALPFLLTAVFLVLTGLAMEAWAPGARSIGEVLAYQG